MSRRTWIAGGTAVLAVAIIGAVAAKAWTESIRPRISRDAVVPFRVDASLPADGAWTLPRDVSPIVRSVSMDDGSIVVMVVDSAADGKNRKVELSLGFGPGARTAVASVTWYGDDTVPIWGPYEFGEDVRGSITIDADRPPAPGDDRIVAYDLRAMRDDQPVELRGKVRIPYVAGSR